MKVNRIARHPYPRFLYRAMRFTPRRKDWPDFMRALAFPVAIIACLFYGLAFDAVVGGLFDGLVCELVFGNECLIPAPLEHWLGFALILLIIPLGCYVALNWFLRPLNALRSTTLFGLLIVS